MNEAQTTSRPRGVAFLLLLPSLLLAWPGPGAILRDVFAATELTATGAALLATLPLGLFALLQNGVARPRFFVLWLPCLVLATFANEIPSWELHDTLEASRSQWMMYIGAAATLAGAATSDDARRAFMRGSMLVSLALTLWALFSSSEVALTGILGNTGELASAALFGAVLGARGVVREQGAWRLVSAATVLGFTIQAAAAPSIANVVAFLIGTLLCTLFEPTKKSERLLRIATALLPLACLLALKAPAGPVDEGEIRTPENVLGGASVRASIARGTLRMFDKAPLLGVGPGQFAVQFPPHRELEEIAASSNRSDTRYYTEVEHPHQDWLLVLSEFGFVAGGALLLFWLLAGIRAVTVLRKGDAIDVPLAAGLLAALAGSFANAPLGVNPTAAIPVFAAMGMLLSGKIAAKSSLVSRIALPVALLLLLCMSVPRAWSAVVHGRSLAAIGQTENPNARIYRLSLADALEACPDSVEARSLSARLSVRLQDTPQKSLKAWRAVLELRPHRVEALLEASRQLALANNFAAAETMVQHALELDAENEVGLRNLARYQFNAGRIPAGLATLETLQELELFDEEYGLSLAATLLLKGRTREGVIVLETCSNDWKELDGDRAWVEAGTRKSAGEELLADAFESYAHLRWARAQVTSGNPKRAVAVYRQNLRITQDYVPGGPIPVLMELCAAQLLAGDPNRATIIASKIDPKALDWTSLPEWAGSELRRSELFR